MTYDHNIYYIIIAILLVNNVMCFCIGYLISRSSEGVSIKDNNIFRKNNTQISTKDKIQIDDKTFVTDIKTDNLEKKYKDLEKLYSELEKQNEKNNKDSTKYIYEIVNQQKKYFSLEKQLFDLEAKYSDLLFEKNSKSDFEESNYEHV